jgi:hypothetical protein
MTSTYLNQHPSCSAFELAYLHGSAVHLDTVQLRNSLGRTGSIAEDHVGNSTALAVWSVHHKNLLDGGNCLLEVVLWVVTIVSAELSESNQTPVKPLETPVYPKNVASGRKVA